jgi:hypothetical protein
MDILIKVVPESEQRPEVNGADWFWDKDGNLQVRVSPMGDWRYEVLLGIHEAVEAVCCMDAGVSQAEVDAFDLEYDKTHTFDVDAGDEPLAPYARQHCIATAVERILCAELGVNWKLYDDTLKETYPGPSKKVNA